MKEYFTLEDFPIRFVFESWVVNAVISLVFTCIAVGVIAILFEGIRVLRVWVKRKFHVSPLFPILPRGLNDTGENDPDVATPSNHSYIKKNRIQNHLTQTVIHVVRVAAGYFLMLAFMTYNVYIGVSILLGAGLGYFLFCHELTKWREPDICSGAASPATAMSSANSTPPGEESHPMLNTCPKGPASINTDGPEVPI